ncbi:sigma-E factor negative regulatory protein [Chitiniphilus purpureus]|uniref:Sigma-E factor negative regulatory protein n=1 Tax=Chitiniphilus purpureus TaxID=2981137 RepID=A0ABY6DHE8_9NEIS|nr:sigma-E factor negative regulatory protein [Chitiniphilus sp. CD1]UXY13765.1 sigma-E factor negative regulatory protein [Chitiniphilus sp. CD1]
MKEQLSALIDSELGRAERDRLVGQLGVDESLRRDWQDWHLVGDVMQEHPLLSPDFMKRFSERLAAEPIVMAPVRRRSLLRRALMPLSAAASVAFVSVVGWQAYYGASRASGGTPGAATTLASTQQHNPLDTARMQGYLAAHRHDGGNPFAGREFMQASFEPSQAK